MHHNPYPFLRIVAAVALLASCGGDGSGPDATAPAGAGLETPTGLASAAPPGDLATCTTQTVSGPDDPCDEWRQEELCQPKEFVATAGVLETTLDIRKQWQCVPAGSDDDWTVTPKLIRNYGAYYDGRWNYTYPAPTFRMNRKPSEYADVEGDRFKMVLTNNLGPTSVDEQKECFRRADNRFRNDVWPNCLHGFETTNFHFHGFHISPQPLQDYVLLKLFPAGTQGVPPYRPDMTNEELRKLPEIAGAYRYDLDPLPYNQPEGTHWYHAHHHGATALQVINGMAGTFLIEGPLDRWLDDHYGTNAAGQPNLKDRLLVVQQINDELGATAALVNGLGNPTVPISPGEVQRWRFVSATTQASAQLEIFFNGLEACQIQMDGVQFSPENYRRQPLLEGESSRTSPCRAGTKFVLSPGNRADFLVRMPPPMTEAAGPVRLEIGQKLVGSVGEEAKGLIDIQRTIALPADATESMPVVPEGPLMTLVLDTKTADMDFPTEWPELPGFLHRPEPTRSKEVAYQMYGGPGNPAPVFKVDDHQVPHPACVPAKMTLERGVDERWVVRNFWNDQPAMVRQETAPRNRGIDHPFHIHTNPFYVVRKGNDEYTHEGEDFAHGVWQDTIALPLATDDDPNKPRATSVDLFMEFEDYTGGYVHHCHILGHEDRGMMSLVQTTCPDGQWGTPGAGGPDDCAVPQDPLPICS